MIKKFVSKLLHRHQWDDYDLFAVRTCTICGCQSRRVEKLK